MATISDEVFTLLLLENYWEGWSTKNFDEYKSEVTIDETTNQKRKRKQHGAHSLVVPGAQEDLEGGQRRALSDSISFIHK